MTILYHYCGAASFKSIIERKALWLCATRRMNDVSETVLVEQLFEECVAARVSSGDLSEAEA
ncbi:hypothetical protein KDX15_31510 [Burkholderia cenocepacia]|uniref:hypothetical protein n=1 Tax=Burkholderia cenocepacia TaxID=95486 RepID=UPI001B9F4969|nr:hypothetical protein [Burkholderia cenocepacia]MBR8278381.1 hypothetical protein [Burkholderia cenocepacia]